VCQQETTTPFLYLSIKHIADRPSARPMRGEGQQSPWFPCLYTVVVESREQPCYTSTQPQDCTAWEYAAGLPWRPVLHGDQTGRLSPLSSVHWSSPTAKLWAVKQWRSQLVHTTGLFKSNRYLTRCNSFKSSCTLGMFFLVCLFKLCFFFPSAVHKLTMQMPIFFSLLVIQYCNIFNIK